MMILAGVDEAGLGPTLGPLATAAAALSVPVSWDPDTPWDGLSAAFCREWGKKERRAGVADSKILYRCGGMAALELTVGAFSFLVNGSYVPPGICDGAEHACYDGFLDAFPLHCESAVVDASAAAMRKALDGAGAGAVHYETALLFEPELNRRYDSGLNKNEALLMETGRHLAALSEKFPDSAILAVVDKQGGRNDYLPFLVALFPGVWPETLETGAECSRYRMRRPGGVMEIRFQAKADRTSFATALASLAAKYMRERAMAGFNAWFGKRFPGVRATAGYPQDAARWLAEIRAGGSRATGLETLIRKR